MAKIIAWLSSTYFKRSLLPNYTNTEFIFSHFIGQMNLQPAKAWLLQFFALWKFQQASRDIGTHMIQMGRNRVHASPEIHVVRKVDFLTISEGSRLIQLEIKAAPQGIHISLILNFFLNFLAVHEIPTFFQLIIEGKVLVIVIPLGDRDVFIAA